MASLIGTVLILQAFLSLVQATSDQPCIAPKVMIVSMFPPEAEVWYNIPEFDLLANNITVTGLSPLFPAVHCTKDYDVCQLTIGEAEINAATSVSALVLSPLFDLTSTYFLIGGIAGINPHEGTLGDVTFARYAVQVALQYEFDAREIPDNFSTGYFPQGSTNPTEYPQSIYGTEAFEVNTALRELAYGFAQSAVLNDSTDAQAYRANYGPALSASSPPSVRKCDVATSDVYFSGTLISEALGNYTTLVTNGTGVYCTTAQEDNATLEALLRGAVAKLVDFARIVILRTASDFDRPYVGESDLQNLVYEDQGVSLLLSFVGACLYDKPRAGVLCRFAVDYVRMPYKTYPTMRELCQTNPSPRQGALKVSKWQ